MKVFLWNNKRGEKPQERYGRGGGGGAVTRYWGGGGGLGALSEEILQNEVL